MAMPEPARRADWIHTLFDKVYRAYNERDAAATTACYADDLVVTVNGEPGPATREALVEGLQEQWAGFPDITATETSRIVAGEQVITEMVIDGHNTAPYQGQRVTGRAWHTELAWVCEIREGRIAVLRVYVDNLSLQEAVRGR